MIIGALELSVLTTVTAMKTLLRFVIKPMAHVNANLDTLDKNAMIVSRMLSFLCPVSQSFLNQVKLYDQLPSFLIKQILCT